MCTYSAVGDHFSKRLAPYVEPYTLPHTPNPWVTPNVPYNPPNTTHVYTVQPTISAEEVRQLRAEIAEMKELLKAAKKIDEIMGEPDCEHGDKFKVIRKLCDMLGIDPGDIPE